MSADRDPELAPEDAGFVRRVGEVYAPPRPTAASRARFDALLAERLSRRAGRAAHRLTALGAAAVTAAAIAFAWAPSQPPRAADVGGTGEGEMLLALALEPAGDVDADLPDDYRALSELFAE